MAEWNIMVPPHILGALVRSCGVCGLRSVSSRRHCKCRCLLRHRRCGYVHRRYDITVAKELLGHEDIKTTLVCAKADCRLLRDAIQSLDALGRNGYKMVTKSRSGEQRLLDGKTSIVSDDSS